MDGEAGSAGLYDLEVICAVRHNWPATVTRQQDPMFLRSLNAYYAALTAKPGKAGRRKQHSQKAQQLAERLLHQR